MARISKTGTPSELGLPLVGDRGPLTTDLINSLSYEVGMRTVRSFEGGFVNRDGKGVGIRFPLNSPNAAFKVSNTEGGFMMVNGPVYWGGRKKYSTIQNSKNHAVGDIPRSHRGGEYKIAEGLAVVDRTGKVITKSSDDTADFLYIKEIEPARENLKILYMEFPDNSIDPLSIAARFAQMGLDTLADFFRQSSIVGKLTENDALSLLQKFNFNNPKAIGELIEYFENGKGSSVGAPTVADIPGLNQSFNDLVTTPITPPNPLVLSDFLNSENNLIQGNPLSPDAGQLGGTPFSGVASVPKPTNPLEPVIPPVIPDIDEIVGITEEFNLTTQENIERFKGLLENWGDVFSSIQNQAIVALFDLLEEEEPTLNFKIQTKEQLENDDFELEENAGSAGEGESLEDANRIPFSRSVVIAVVLPKTNEVLQNVTGPIYKPVGAFRHPVPTPAMPLLPALEATTPEFASADHPFKVTPVVGGVKISEGRFYCYFPEGWWQNQNTNPDSPNAIAIGEGLVPFIGINSGFLVDENFLSFSIPGLGIIAPAQDAVPATETTPEIPAVPAQVGIPTEPYSVYIKISRDIDITPITVPEDSIQSADIQFTSDEEAGETLKSVWSNHIDGYLIDPDTLPYDAGTHPRDWDKGNSMYFNDGVTRGRYYNFNPSMMPNGTNIDPLWNPDKNPSTLPNTENEVDDQTSPAYNCRWKVTINMATTANFKKMSSNEVEVAPAEGQTEGSIRRASKRRGSYSMGGWSKNRQGAYIGPADYPEGYEFFTQFYPTFMQDDGDIQELGGTEEVGRKMAQAYLSTANGVYAYSFWEGGDHYIEVARISASGEVTENMKTGSKELLSLTKVKQFLRSDYFFYPPADAYWTYNESPIWDFRDIPVCDSGSGGGQGDVLDPQ